MKAIGVVEARPTSDPDCFVAFDAATPSPGPRDLLVRIEAVSVNPVDYKVRQGISGPLAEPRIIGWDACGTVEAVGAEVAHHQPGDRVMYAGSIDRPGSYAELQLVDERIVGRKPISLDDAAAAALPLTSLTAWEGLFDRLQLDRPDGRKRRLLIIGGAGGVGSMAIQLARRLTDTEIVATASRPETRDWCLELGAHHVIDHAGDLTAAARASGLDQVTDILNCNNNLPYWEAMAELIAPQGRLCLLSSTGQPVNLDIFMSKSVAVCWELMYTRSSFATHDMARQRDILCRIADLVEDGTVRSTMQRCLGGLSAANAAAAHEALESRTMIGKLVMTAIA